jgi:hypothetical protein
MEQYQKLYADDFSGVKRVGEHVVTMGKDEWLKDRRKLSLKTPRVEVTALRFYTNGNLVVAEFHQRWATKGFADEGTKALTLRKRSGSWEIVREAMMVSRVLSKEERAQSPQVSGHCERLGENLEHWERAGHLWRFADMGGETGEVKWASVSTWEEAESKAPHGSVWSSATVVSDGKWLLAYSSLFSPSGDSGILTTQCYRPNGALARFEDAYRTFHTARGLAEDLRVTVYDEQGTAGFSTRRTYVMESGEPLAPSEMMGTAKSAPEKHVSALPYFALLPEAVRKRY